MTYSYLMINSKIARFALVASVTFGFWACTSADKLDDQGVVNRYNLCQNPPVEAFGIEKWMLDCAAVNKRYEEVEDAEIDRRENAREAAAAADRAEERRLNREAAGSRRFPAAEMRNAEIEAQLRRVALEYIREREPGASIVKIAILSREWKTERNELTGVILARSVLMAIAFKSANGECSFTESEVSQNYDGRNYGQFIINRGGFNAWMPDNRDFITCSNI